MSAEIRPGWVRVSDLLAAAADIKTFETVPVTDEADGGVCLASRERTAVEIIEDAITRAGAR